MRRTFIGISALVLAGVMLAAEVALPAGSVVMTAAMASPSDASSNGDAAYGPSVAEASSTLDVRALGSAEQARTEERRSFRHSGLQTTGRFVRSGQQLTVDVPAGVTGLIMRIGADGVYAALNGGVEKSPSTVALVPGTQVITAPQDGLVHVEDAAPEGSRTSTLTVAGGIAVPTFIAGVTTPAQFDAQVAATDPAVEPFATLIGKRVTADMQLRSVKDKLVAGTALERTDILDEVIDAADDLWGLRRGGSGLQAKSAHRVRVISPDSGGGYANASNDRISFQVSTGAASEILWSSRDDMWGYWHEVGHTYQPSVVRWDGLGEVSVNITSAAVQERLGFDSRLDGWSAKIRDYLARPAAERSFDSIDGWWKMFMFDQLRRAFGDGFYARLNQDERAAIAMQDGWPSSSDELKQNFVVMASKVADRDLTAFFDAWGFTMTDTTRATIAKHPKLHNQIWMNLDIDDKIVERKIAYSSISARMTTTGTATLGQYQLGDKLSATVDSIDGGTAVGTPRVNAWTAGPGAGVVAQRIVNDDGTQNAAIAHVDVLNNENIAFLGLGDTRYALLALDPTDGSIHASAPNTGKPHSYFPGTEYFGARYLSAAGVEIASVSVNGDGNSSPVVQAFDGIEYRDGDFLVIRHQEPRQRLQRWNDGVQVAGSTEKEQAFRVQSGSLQAVPLIQLPTALTHVATPETELERGEDTVVPIEMQVNAPIHQLKDGAVVLNAPAGTKFDTSMRTIPAQKRKGSDPWANYGYAGLSDVTYSDDGTKATIEWNRGAVLDPGEHLRWLPELQVVTDAAVKGNLSYTAKGTSRNGPAHTFDIAAGVPVKADEKSV